MDEIPAAIHRLAEYWKSLAGGSAPDRSLLDPSAIRPLLPFILLTEFEDRPFRVRYRLTGTRVDEMTGMNITGRYLDEFAHGIYRDAVELIGRAYEVCRDTGAPVIDSYLWPDDDNLSRLVWMGLFPLRIGGEVRQCLEIEDYGALGSKTDPIDWRIALQEK
jgi:hypothetical protein